MYRRFIIIPMLYYLDALLDEILSLSDTESHTSKSIWTNSLGDYIVSPQADCSQFII